MSFTLYGLKTCDTCRNALKELKQAGKPVEFVDLREECDLAERVPVWLEALGNGLLNRSSTTWRKLDETEKARAETDLASLLVEHPTLIKRPVIDTGSEILVSWRREVRDHLI